MAQNTRIDGPRVPQQQQVPAAAPKTLTFAAYKAATSVPHESRDGTVRQIDKVVEAYLTHPANRAKFDTMLSTVMGSPAQHGFMAQPGLLQSLGHHPQRQALIGAQMNLIIAQANRRFAPRGTPSRNQPSGGGGSGSRTGSGHRGGTNIIVVNDGSNRGQSGGGSGSSGGSGNGGGGSGS